jgi:hypothetical protein
MSNKVTVILLGHKSLSGKDTFFEAVEDMGFARAAFADKLKSTVADLYNFSHDQMYGEGKDIQDERYPNTVDKEWVERDIEGIHGSGRELVKNPDYKAFFTPRRILQLFGQQQRSLFPDIWASYVFSTKIPELISKGHSNIIVTDFRFQNEAKVSEKFAKESGYDLHTVKIVRPDVLAKSGANDISEVDLDNYPFMHVLHNEGTLEEFQKKARDFVSNL